MQNITFNAPTHLIEAARKAAQSQNSTLNAEFRQWWAQVYLARDRARAREDRAIVPSPQATGDAPSDGRKFT